MTISSWKHILFIASIWEYYYTEYYMNIESKRNISLKYTAQSQYDIHIQTIMGMHYFSEKINK